MGTSAQAYAARMRSCANAMGRELAAFKERDVAVRLTEGDAQLAEQGFTSGLVQLAHPNRIRTPDPYQETAWVVEGNPARLCWEYLPHLAAYVELVQDLGYPIPAVRFETPELELNLDLAALDADGRVLVLGEAKSEPTQLVSLEGLVPTFDGDPGKPAPRSAAGAPQGALREAWKLAHQLWVTRAPHLWLVASGARFSYDVGYGDRIEFRRRDRLPAAVELWPADWAGPTPRLAISGNLR